MKMAGGLGLAVYFSTFMTENVLEAMADCNTKYHKSPGDG